MPSLKHIITYIAVLSGFLGPLYALALLYIMIRYKAVNKQNRIELIVCIVLSVGAYIYLGPSVSVMLTVRSIAIIIVVIFVLGIVKLIRFFRK